VTGLTAQRPDAGVYYVTWWPDTGRSDTFVVAEAGTAGVRWLALADVVIGPTQRSLPAARGFTVEFLARFPGCAVAAAGVPRHGSVVRCRNGRALLCPGGGLPADAWWLAALAYVSITWRA